MVFGKNSKLSFTLTELTMAMAIGTILAALILSYMHVAAVLTAKNLGTNFSHNSLHKSLDWVTERIQNAEYIPVLLTSGTAAVTLSATGSEYLTSGSAVASTESTPVMGIYYDRLVGAPYAFASQSGSLSPGTTSVTVQYSSNVYANPPAPQANDVLLVNGATSTTGSGTFAVTTTLRPLVSSATVTTSGSYKSAAITLSGSFGGTYS